MLPVFGVVDSRKGLTWEVSGSVRELLQGSWWTLSWRSVGWETDTGPIRVSPSQCVYVSVVCSSVRFLFLIMNLS